MGKASSTKKVARAARAGGNRRAGQRRNLGFPTAITGVVILGLLLVVVTRQDRISNAAPRVNTGAPGDDHWHVPYDTYTCVPDPSTPVTPPTTVPTASTDPTGSTLPPTSIDPANPTGGGSTTTPTAPPAPPTTATGQGQGGDTPLESAAHLGAAQTPPTDPSTTTTPTTIPTTPTTIPTTPTTAPQAAPTSSVPESTTTTTLIAQPGDVPGIFQAPFHDAGQDVNGIHTHGDGVMHIHPFKAAGAGRNAQLSVFLAQVGVTLTDDTLSFVDPVSSQLLTYKEGTTKCQDGRDAIVQVGLWDKVDDAANGQPPNQVITTHVADVRLKNGHPMTIAFLPKDSRIPIQPDIKKRFETLTDVSPTTTVPAGSDASSGEPSSGSPSSGSPSSTETTVPASTSTTAPSGG